MAKSPSPPQRCQWITEKEALIQFASSLEKTQSAAHIKPLHWYVACRLVLEGGFLPEEISPRPPFITHREKEGLVLAYSEEAAGSGERTILGGLKTKDVDVVVTKDGIGPVMAVSCKGMTGALRNLTNRMEETIGECTNLHITYPALVFGYLFALRAYHKSDQLKLGIEDNGIAIVVHEGVDRVVESVQRFQFALTQMSGRDSIRDEPSKYESVSLILVDLRTGSEGSVIDSLMPADSLLRLQDFFPRLYRAYDERFVVAAPLLAGQTRRIEWLPSSPVFQNARFHDPAYAWRSAS